MEAALEEDWVSSQSSRAMVTWFATGARLDWGDWAGWEAEYRREEALGGGSSRANTAWWTTCTRAEGQLKNK
jgi:hypothetical protein